MSQPDPPRDTGDDPTRVRTAEDLGAARDADPLTAGRTDPAPAEPAPAPGPADRPPAGPDDAGPAADGPARSGSTEPAPRTWRPEPTAGETAPAWSTRPVAVRRGDAVAAVLLLLAGVAAGISLLLPWLPDGPTGLDLARSAVDQATAAWTGLFSTGLWQPAAVLGGGALLAVLGLLLLVPARTHRVLGLLALLVAGAVVAAVLVPLGLDDWQLGRFGVGFVFALAVAALGLLGALKAMLTGPELR